MKKTSLIKTLFLANVFIFNINPANALGQVSRACNFYSLPGELKPVAAAFFYALGADAEVLTLPAQSYSVQETKWILESLTTDYGNVRYLLFATRIVYFSDGSLFVNGNQTYTTYNRQRNLDLSSQWTAEQISNAMKSDPKFSTYYLNRGILYSARAGVPGIIETFPVLNTGNLSSQYMVEGLHWYYDPVAKQVVRLPNSKASTCNLGNFGVGTGLFNR